MPQLYCQLASRPSPWLLGRTSAGLCTLQTACPLTVTYSGGSPGADTIASGSAATVYGGSAAAFDASADVWVVLTASGSGTLQVTKEADLAAVTGDWAGLARIVQHSTEPYQPQAYLAAGSVLTTTTTTLLSDAGAKAVAIAAGADPDALYPGWHTVGFDDSAWPAAVPVTPNSADLALVPAGASALWSKASGAPYRVSGGAIGSFSVPVTSSTGGAPTWTLTIGDLYALETTGGPFYEDVTLTPQYTTVQYSQDGGATWRAITNNSLPGGVPADSWETTADANHFRIYLRATATGLRVRVADSVYSDNSGSISVTLSPAEAIAVLVRQSVALPAGPVSSALLQAAFDSAGDAWVNAVHEAADADTTAAGPLLSVSVAPAVLTAGASNVVATHARGPGGSSPDKGWVAFSLAVAASGLAGGAGGTVTSVGLSAPAPLTAGGSPVTAAGTLALSWATGQTQNRVLASPNGSSGAVSLRALVGNDIPVDASTIVSSAGTIKGNYQAGSGVSISGNTISATGSGGSVTSVALALPGIFSVSGSPITSSGTLNATLASQTRAAVFAGPASGSAAAPTFRALQGSDLPPAAAAGGHIHAHGHFL